MSEPEIPNRKALPFAAILLLSFLLFSAGFVVDQCLRWSDPWAGLLNGIMHLPLLSIPWLLFVLPWSLLIRWLYRSKGWDRFRSLCLLLPCMVTLGISVLEGLMNPVNPQSRFQSFAHTEFPDPVENLQSSFRGGGLADYTHSFYFETRRSETERLIHDMRLVKRPAQKRPLPDLFSMQFFSGAPDYRQLDDIILYEWDYDDGRRFFYLLTDSSHTRVYILLGTI